jgi:catechol-2,3-dioxygenase
MAGIPVTGVSELVLEVVDLPVAERFYAEVLGFPVVERWEEREAVWVMAGDRTRIGTLRVEQDRDDTDQRHYHCGQDRENTTTH